jgi:hypothetical protein
MTEDVNTADIENEATDELTLLKKRATTMGIPFKANIGIDTLKNKINAKLTGDTGSNEDENADEDEDDEPVAVARPARKKTKAEIEQETRDRLQKEKMVLVRCRIYNLNPSKRDLQGEIITVANKYLGTVRKFIPFGEQTDNGYHIPKVIYDDLKGRKYQHVKTKKVQGQIQVETRMVPEYNIELMEPLSKEELAELALKQSAAQRLGA